MLEFIEKPGFVIVLLVFLVVFGAKRLPDSARSLGRSMRILKAEAKGLKDDDLPAPAPAPPTAVTAGQPVQAPVAQPPIAQHPVQPVGVPVADQAEHRA